MDNFFLEVMIISLLAPVGLVPIILNPSPIIQ